MPDVTTSALTDTATETKSRGAEHIAGSPRILIIDDESAIRESLDTMLTLEGFSVSMAGDGAAGETSLWVT